jgi:CelD/BcsL family acetyltransferase involved in cellulose biosynthesis
MGKAANLIRETLFVGRKHRWDVLVLHDVPEQDEWQRQLVGHEIRRTPSPFERFRGTSWDAYLASKSKNFREQVRRRERRLREAFSVVLRLATRETIGEDMTTLFRLHTMRWGQDAGFANGAERRLHEDFAQVAVRQGWLRLWLMELDGVPAGAVYGFRFGQAEYYYQSGRDPGFDSHSIGFVLLGHAMRCALEDGMTEYRLLRGDEDYKSRFASHERTLHSVAIARGRKGRAAIAVKESLRVGRSQ